MFLEFGCLFGGPFYFYSIQVSLFTKVHCRGTGVALLHAVGGLFYCCLVLLLVSVLLSSS